MKQNITTLAQRCGLSNTLALKGLGAERLILDNLTYSFFYKSSSILYYYYLEPYYLERPPSGEVTAFMESQRPSAAITRCIGFPEFIKNKVQEGDFCCANLQQEKVIEHPGSQFP
jgi:hypothetical protein